MNALLIANPNASTTDERVIDAVRSVISRRYREVRVVRTAHRMHARNLASDAVADGLDLVVSLGGDGTANEVIQALAATDVPLAVLPGGGANVLARTLGLPEDPVRAASLLLPESGPHLRRVGLGRANGRWFAVSTGLGFDAQVVGSVERHPHLKRFLRDAAFVSLAFADWFASTDRRDVPLRVELPDGSIHGDYWAVVVSNSDPFTFLGALPMRLTPGVGFDDALDVLAVSGASTTHVLRLVGRVFAGARHQHDPAVQIFRELDGLIIRAPSPRPFQVDGDTAGMTESLEIVRCPHALTLLVVGRTP